MEGTYDKGLEMCACQSSKAWWLGGVDRQFAKNIPQMTLNPWWHEIQNSDSPGFFPFNYMVLCDYHKSDILIHRASCTHGFSFVSHCSMSTCLSLGTMPVGLLTPLTATRTLKCLLCGTILLTYTILKLASLKYFLLFYQFSKTNIYNFSFYSCRPASQHVMTKINKSELHLFEDQSRIGR